jgi:hypothetical protein
MDNQATNDSPESQSVAIDHFRDALAARRDWPEALLEAMALWTVPEEIYEGRVLNYFIGGEALDWLLLAERLIDTADCTVPDDERDDLLFSGRFPQRFDMNRIQELLGVAKYRGYLNYFYGVTVEESLQLACALEAEKRETSNGVRYRSDYTDRAFTRIYFKSRRGLLRMFRESDGSSADSLSSMAEHRAFTYWLFKYRWANSDKAKIASDTNKGIRHLERMTQITRRKSRVTVSAGS